MTLPNLFLDSNRALTFTIGDTQFGIEVTSILAFSDAYNEIRTPSETINGLLGYLDYRDNLVQVFECATLLNRPLKRKATIDLIAELDVFKTSYAEWFDALENSLRRDQSFDKVRDAKQSEFGRWFYNFECNDDGLKAILARIEEPHQHIHNLADKLLALKEENKGEEALTLLHQARSTSLQRLIRLLKQTQDYLSSGIHPVVLHLTRDGHTPWFSLVLDEIDDIIDYDPSWIDLDAKETLSNEPVSGYIRHKSGARFMMLSTEALIKRAPATELEPELAELESD